MGWTFKAVPRFVAEGLINNSFIRWKSPTFHDYKHPEAWIGTPPPGHSAPVRRFDNASPHLLCVGHTSRPSHPRWRQRVTAMSRLSEACRAKDRIIPRIIELDATTPAGVVAKAEVIGSRFNGTGQRSDAVRSLVADLLAVVGRAGA